MQVIKCINNNVVSCRDGKGHEMIAMGRGLGFALRPGDEVDEEKVVHLKIGQPDVHLLQLVLEAVDGSVYLTLTDHICFAIDRMRSGTTFQNTLLAEVRTFYPREYTVGKYALELLAQELDVHFPDDEAANIALHLVNAEYENSISDTLRITQTLHDILSTLTGWPRLHLDTASGFYDEFTVHLKFLVLRAFSGNGQPRGDEGFVASVRRCYPDEFHCAQQIIEGLERRTGNSLPAEEQAYLAASLHRTCRLV